MPLEVRRLEATDLERIEARETFGQGFVRAMWGSEERGESVLVVAVAWSDGVPMGSAQLDLRTDPFEVKNLHVDEHARGQGIGTALIAHRHRDRRAAGEGSRRRSSPLSAGRAVPNSCRSGAGMARKCRIAGFAPDLQELGTTASAQLLRFRAEPVGKRRRQGARRRS